jgi:hypothetical protein
MLIKCTVFQVSSGLKEFWINFSECPPLNSVLEIGGIEYEVFKITKHLKKDLVIRPTGDLPVFKILSTTILLDRRR